MALGGALGTLARYGMDRVVAMPSGAFPWATLLVNASGSLLVGLALSCLIDRSRLTLYSRIFLVVGVLGGYTTFSTVVVEALLLVRGGHATTAGLYLVASIVVGPAAVYAGVATASALRRSALDVGRTGGRAP